MKSHLLVAIALLLAGIGPVAAGADMQASGLLAPSERIVPSAGPLRSTEEGFEFVDQEGPAAGDGELRTYRLEVEPATGINPRVFTDLAERILSNPRGWTGAADWTLQWVPGSDADIRVVLATPDTVDRLCARAGLRTVGRLSCWNGQFAAINVDRWKHGSKGFVGPLHVYRRYVLNHEVGHALGYGHRVCPRRDARAPVMQQQTLATRPCRANGWPARDP